MENIGDKINSLRKENKMSQENLAKKLGITRQSVSKWESGNTSPDIENILLLAKTFNISTDYLLGATDKKDNTVVEPVEKIVEIQKESILDKKLSEILGKEALSDNNIDMTIEYIQESLKEKKDREENPEEHTEKVIVEVEKESLVEQKFAEVFGKKALEEENIDDTISYIINMVKEVNTRVKENNTKNNSVIEEKFKEALGEEALLEENLDTTISYVLKGLEKIQSADSDEKEEKIVEVEKIIEVEKESLVEQKFEEVFGSEALKKENIDTTINFIIKTMEDAKSKDEKEDKIIEIEKESLVEQKIGEALGEKALKEENLDMTIEYILKSLKVMESIENGEEDILVKESEENIVDNEEVEDLNDLAVKVNEVVDIDIDNNKEDISEVDLYNDNLTSDLTNSNIEDEEIYKDNLSDGDISKETYFKEDNSEKNTDEFGDTISYDKDKLEKELNFFSNLEDSKVEDLNNNYPKDYSDNIDDEGRDLDADDNFNIGVVIIYVIVICAIIFGLFYFFTQR